MEKYFFGNEKRSTLFILLLHAVTVKESETCPVIPLIVGRRISNWSRQDAARSVSVVRIIVIMLRRWERHGTTENGWKLLGGWRTSALHAHVNVVNTEYSMHYISML